jgi:hypothetical protein
MDLEVLSRQLADPMPWNWAQRVGTALELTQNLEELPDSLRQGVHSVLEMYLQELEGYCQEHTLNFGVKFRPAQFQLLAQHLKWLSLDQRERGQHILQEYFRELYESHPAPHFEYTYGSDSEDDSQVCASLEDPQVCALRDLNSAQLKILLEFAWNTKSSEMPEDIRSTVNGPLSGRVLPTTGRS